MVTETYVQEREQDLHHRLGLHVIKMRDQEVQLVRHKPLVRIMEFVQEVQLDQHKRVHRLDLHSRHVRHKLLVLLVPKAQDRLIIRRHQDLLQVMILDLVLLLEVLVVVHQEAHVLQGDNKQQTTDNTNAISVVR